MKAKTLMVAVTASLLVTATTPVYAMVNSEGLNRSMEQQVEPSEPSGMGQDAVILPMPYDLKDDTRSNLVQDGPDGSVSSPDMDYNHSAIDAIQNYIKENIDSKIYASLYIDWEPQAAGTIVLSFTEELSNDKQAELLTLAGDNKLKFRIVDYNEAELRDKQHEIDQQWAALEKKGIRVMTTGASVRTNKVEVAIEPYNEQNIAIVHEIFGEDMVEVVQGFEIQLMATTDLPLAEGEDARTTAIDTNEEASEEKMTTTTEEKKGFFQRIADFFRNLFGKDK